LAIEREVTRSGVVESPEGLTGSWRRNLSIGLLIVRLVVGLTLAAHGAQKLLGWFGGGGIAGTGAGLERLGFRPGRVHATLAGVVEVGAGLFVAAGFLTPAAAAAAA